jgi:predicted lipoprotein with Yx(FWY)xxD motif
VKTLRTRTTLLVASLAGVVAVVAAGGGAAASTQVAGSRTNARTATIVKLRATSLGKVLVDSRGRTLYLLTADGKNKSTCYGQCTSFWPPLLTTGKPKAGVSVKASLLRVTMRRDGKHQVTYAGHPLYRFVQDAKAGQTHGEGVSAFGGEWYVLSAAGAKVEPKAESTTTPTGTTTTSGGYDYGGGY